MKITELVCATRNRGKIRELEAQLLDFPLVLKSLDDIGFTEDTPETGLTFGENARLKAEAACLFSGLPAFADDSGLVVEALGGAPGIYSARYGTEDLDDKGRTALLLENLAHVPAEKRTARFVCAIALVLPDGQGWTVEGQCLGTIALAPRGADGFGYDPVFLVGEKTFAQMTPGEKEKLSHRGQAVEKLKEILMAQME